MRRSRSYMALIVLKIAHSQQKKRNFNFFDVNAAGPAQIAKIAAENGVSRFIHVSHLNANEKSSSQYYKTKAIGEELVKEAFPDATIVRPAVMFGYEDKLLNNMARE